ncbi:MAG: hypothetical protein E7476_05955 [Ruminococcaceae bacterium]|nr:hypothetical protein [Oscillospiraceae bacterium]
MIQPTHGMLQKLPETSFSSAAKQLYLLALLSLGDPAAAEQTVREALLYTAQRSPGNTDSGRFFALTVKKLYRNIKKAAKKTVYQSCLSACTGFSDLNGGTSCVEAEPMMRLLSQFPFPDRFLVVCCAQRYPVTEIAEISGMPVWFVRKRLDRAVHRIAGSLQII